MAIKSSGGSLSQGTTDELQAKLAKQGKSSKDKNYSNLQDESEHSDQDDSISLHPSDNEFSEGEDEDLQAYVNPPLEADLIDDVEDPYPQRPYGLY